MSEQAPEVDADALAKEAEVEAVVRKLPQRPLVADMPWRAPKHASEGTCMLVAMYHDDETGHTAVFAAKGIKQGEDVTLIPGPQPILMFTWREWDAFIGGAKDGEFDLDKTPAADPETSARVREEVMANLRFASCDEAGYLQLPSELRALRAGAAVLNPGRPADAA